jgi:hypothetical protein
MNDTHSEIALSGAMDAYGYARRALLISRIALAVSFAALILAIFTFAY